MSPCPTAPPKGFTHSLLCCCLTCLRGLPEKLALGSLRPAPNIQECAGLFCPLICTCRRPERLGMGRRQTPTRGLPWWSSG